MRNQNPKQLAFILLWKWDHLSPANSINPLNFKYLHRFSFIQSFIIWLNFNFNLLLLVFVACLLWSRFYIALNIRLGFFASASSSSLLNPFNFHSFEKCMKNSPKSRSLFLSLSFSQKTYTTWKFGENYNFAFRCRLWHS